MDVEWIGKCQFRRGRWVVVVAIEGSKIWFNDHGDGGAQDVENANGVQYLFEECDFIEEGGWHGLIYLCKSMFDTRAQLNFSCNIYDIE